MSCQCSYWRVAWTQVKFKRPTTSHDTACTLGSSTSPPPLPYSTAMMPRHHKGRDAKSARTSTLASGSRISMHTLCSCSWHSSSNHRPLIRSAYRQEGQYGPGK